jgi:hypothetical protein
MTSRNTYNYGESRTGSPRSPLRTPSQTAGARVGSPPRTGSPRSPPRPNLRPTSPRLSPRRTPSQSAGAGAGSPPRSPRTVSLARQIEEEKKRIEEEKKIIDEMEMDSIISSNPFLSSYFNGGGIPLKSMISAYSYSSYYQIKLTFLDEENQREINHEFILNLPKDYLTNLFLSANRRFTKAIIHSYFPEFASYRITKVEYKEIKYPDLKNEEVIFSDIYDIASLFQFYDISERYNTPIQQRDILIKDELIELAKIKYYKRYVQILNELDPRLLHELLPHIPVNDYELVEPLFKGRTPIIFKSELFLGQTMTRDEMNRRINESYTITTIKNKFIVRVLIQSIKDNNIRLFNAIINSMLNLLSKRSNKVLVEYCIEVAKEYNRNHILQILFQKYDVLNR